ncbi:MAG: 23S rRNA (guanosine(2251)-2'-O)-methyltransferase RlmB [Eubacteriales bacterium]|nr:23S rRNA (guanosine(2251)-2'-O)-methyltransferase RlmB [Eubacteriales bacterium]
MKLPQTTELIYGNEYTASDIIEGRNPVIEAIKSGRAINKIFIATGDREGSIIKAVAMARERGLVVIDVDKAKLDSMSSTGAHQGIIAYVAAHEYVEPGEILAKAESKGEQPFVIILDGITDPQNLGAIIRSANAAGAHGVIITKRRSAGLNSIAAKVSAGAIEYVPVARVANLAQTMAYLKEKGLWIAGTDISGDKPFYEADLKGPLALVIGSEGEGMSRIVREKCDFVVNIPMAGSISSLNAAAAGTVVMYEVMLQRMGKRRG